jgi:UDP-3-O-[3-hydroxymyristoyl] glucosamine N-acyltransferase
MEYTVREIAEILQASYVGNGDLMIMGVNQIDKASQGDLTFMGQKKYHQYLETT